MGRVGGVSLLVLGRQGPGQALLLTSWVKFHADIPGQTFSFSFLFEENAGGSGGGGGLGFHDAIMLSGF